MGRTHRGLVALLLATGIACSGPEAAEPPVEGPSVEGSTSGEDPPPGARPWESPEARAELARAPSQTACETDDDCMPFHGAGEAPPAVCCSDSTTGITTRAYLLWVARFRERFCTGAPCETPMIPGALPADCFFAGRCVDGVCGTACDDVRGPSVPEE